MVDGSYPGAADVGDGSRAAGQHVTTRRVGSNMRRMRRPLTRGQPRAASSSRGTTNRHTMRSRVQPLFEYAKDSAWQRSER